jgi:hypothetical protein
VSQQLELRLPFLLLSLVYLVSTFVDTSIIGHKQVKVKHISQTFLFFSVLPFVFPAYVSIIQGGYDIL